MPLWNDPTEKSEFDLDFVLPVMPTPVESAQTEETALPCAQMTADEMATFLLSRRGYRSLAVPSVNLTIPVIVVATLRNLATANWLWAGNGAILMAAILTINRLAARLDRAEAALQVPELDLQHIGALAQTLEYPDERIAGIARILLTRLLPKVGDGSASPFTEGQRACLHQALTPCNAATNAPFVLAILDILEQIGDAQALPCVDRLASMWWVCTPTLRQVRRTAANCLLAIEQRIQQQAAQTLTLASESGAQTVADAEATPEALAAAARVDAHLKAFEEESRNRRPGMRFGFLVALWCTVVPYTAWQTWVALTDENWPLLLLWSTLTTIATQFYRFTLSPEQAMLARRLAELDDVQGVGRLAEALEWPDAEIRFVAVAALTRLLPRLKASDARLLNARQRAALYRMLKWYNATAHMDFLMAILTALEQVGDSAALPYVEDLAKRRPFSWSQRRVQTAAADCLPYLRVRAAQDQVSQTLLRASSATGLSPEELVRPAYAITESHEEQLLRASIFEKE